MYKIYETAIVCNIWLGPGDANSSMAIKYAMTLDGEPFLLNYSNYLEFGGGGYWERKAHILDYIADHPDKQSLINACANFLLRPWFTRVWCSQEGAVSTNTVVYCGTDHAPWLNIYALAWLFLPARSMDWPSWFTTGYNLLEPNLFNALNIQRYRLRRMNIENGADFHPTSLLVSVLQSAAWRLNCYDPRDKIYAMRNIASDAKDLNDDWTPKPDYKIPWRELYTQFAITLAERGDKEFLRLSGLLRQGHDSALHSWVPDWRAYPKHQYIVHDEWCAGSKRDLRMKVNRIPRKRRQKLLGLLARCPSATRALTHTMSLTTVMQNEIVYVSGTVPQYKRYADIGRIHEAVASIDEANIRQLESLEFPTYFTSEDAIDAYNSTLIGNTTEQDTLASKSYVKESIAVWRSWITAGADMSKVPIFHEAIDTQDTFSLKQFCITKEGYFCLVPSEAMPTDFVMIVKGFDMPMLFRPIGDCYIYIGDCYVHGMMELQALTMMEEFSIKIKDGQAVWKPEGDVRANGLSLDVGEYKRILGTLGERWIELI